MKDQDHPEQAPPEVAHERESTPRARPLGAGSSNSRFGVKSGTGQAVVFDALWGVLGARTLPLVEAGDLELEVAEQLVGGVLLDFLAALDALEAL